MNELDNLRLHRIGLAAASLVLALEVVRAPAGTVDESDRQVSEEIMHTMLDELDEQIDLWRVTR